VNIFLQGNSGVGKSLILKEALAPIAPQLAGFVVQRLTENGVTVGFRAVLLEGEFPSPEAVYIPEQAGVFMIHSKWDVSVLEAVIARVEENSRRNGCKLVLLDEIGGIELNSAAFMATLKRVFSGGVPCSGVFKSHENLSRMASNLALGREYFTVHKELMTLLRERGELVHVTGQNRTEIYGYLTNRLRLYLLEGNMVI